MKKFNVTIIRKEIYVEDVEIEAETKEQAIAEAERIDIEEGEIEWDEMADVEYDYKVEES